MGLVILQGLTKEQNIIKIIKDFREMAGNDIHSSLECRGGVCQAKRYH